jgi:Xaa-Pro aminopeptidase
VAIDPERYARTVGALRDSLIDAAIVSSPSQVLLLTGYWPVMGASVACFTAAGEIQLIVPEDEADLASRTSSAPITPYKPASLHSLDSGIDTLKEPVRSVVATLGLPEARIGVELALGVQPASYAVSAQYRSSLVELLQELLPGATYVACDELFQSMKATKTAKELELMQNACRIAGAGFLKAEEDTKPGLSEPQLASAIQSSFDIAPEGADFERSYGYFFCMSGLNSAKAAAAYARTRQRIVEEGDLVMVHANTCADGYWTDITRTYTAGEASPRQDDIRGAIAEARAAGLHAIHPGATGREVDEAVRSVMRLHGYGEAFKHAAGHGVGFAAANANARPRIHPLSPDVLEAGMTFNLEPAAYFNGYGGMRHCDVVAVTADGVRVMTDF